MKKSVLFLIALFSLVSFAANGAKAAEDHPFGNDFADIANMGLVLPNWTGTIATNNLPFFVFDKAWGSLAPNTQISFSYSVAPNWDGGVDPYTFSVIPPVSEPAGNYKVTKSFVTDGEGGVTTFSIIIANLMNNPLGFLSSIYLPGYEGTVTTTYNTTAVPLPAALPLFGLGLIGLAGIKRLKKNKASA